MKRTSITGSQRNHSYIIGILLSLVPFSLSDTQLFRAHRVHIQSSEALFIEWGKAEAQRNMVQRFVKEFRELNSQKLTKSMEMFHEYLIEVKKASAQSAVTFMIYHYTFERRSFSVNETEPRSVRSHENQLINMWLVKYMETTDDEYVATFRSECINRTLDLTTVQECIQRDHLTRPILALIAIGWR